MVARTDARDLPVEGVLLKMCSERTLSASCSTQSTASSGLSVPDDVGRLFRLLGTYELGGHGSVFGVADRGEMPRRLI